jgi:hypothetical protein
MLGLRLASVGDPRPPMPWVSVHSPVRRGGRWVAQIGLAGGYLSVVDVKI